MDSARAVVAALLIPTLHTAVCANELAVLQPAESLLVLERTSKSLSYTGDPIWTLRLERPGKQVIQFEAVSGRAHRQNADRDRTGSRAPLPSGYYSLGPVEPLGPADPAELGPIWIGIEPLFPTGRGHLGIHLDPSANRNANSGTLGCVGLIHHRDMVQLASLVQRHNIRALLVKD